MTVILIRPGYSTSFSIAAAIWWEIRAASSSSTSPGSTTTRTSRPARIAKTRSTPWWRPAISSSSRSRVTYSSRESPRAPGRAPERASAACTITASTVFGSTSLWWASIACATASDSPWRRAIRPATIACVPSTSCVTALPMSCRSAARRAVSTLAPSSPAMIAAMPAHSTR